MFDWILGVMVRGGYAGLFMLALLENVFPPIPSEVIMPLAGFLAARGEMDMVGVIAAGTVGSVVGATFWYYLGMWLGMERIRRLAARHGRWLTMSPEDVDRTAEWFLRNGPKAVLLGRVMPGLRTLISVPAGVFRMPLLPFLAYSLVGTTVWIALLAGAGYLLKDAFMRVGDWLDPISNAVLGLGLAWYGYRVITWSQPSTESPRSPATMQACER